MCTFQITVKLDLRSNNIEELPTGAFKHTPYLTHLSLQRTGIRKVREGAFRSLGRLVFLNLAYNDIDILYQVRTEQDQIHFKYITLSLNCYILCIFYVNRKISATVYVDHRSHLMGSPP